MMSGQNCQPISADFIGNVTISRDAVGTDNYPFDLAAPQYLSGRAVAIKHNR